MVELLLSKQSVHNLEATFSGVTHFQYANITGKSKVIVTLLEHGANINIIDSFGFPPLEYSDETNKKILIKELAKLRFNNQYVCSEYIVYIQGKEDLLETFESCLEELQRLKDHIVFGNTSLYDILQSCKQRKKLILLTRNENFVAAFQSSWNHALFKNYGEDINDNFKKALENSITLQSEEEKYYSVFKDFLPELAIREIAFSANEHLFFKIQYSPIIYKLEKVINRIDSFLLRLLDKNAN